MLLWSKTIPPVRADGYTVLRTRDIRIQPTRLGCSVLVVCVLLWIMAINYQVNIAYVLISLLLGSGLCGALAGIQQLKGLVLEIVPEAEYFADRPVLLTVRCPAAGRKRWVWFYTGAAGEAEEVGNWQLWPISREHQTFQWQLPPQPRGYLSLLSLPCLSTAPFGLVKVEALWQYDGEIVVYPKPIQHFFSAANASGEEQSSREAVLSGDDLAFLLPHQNSSSIRQIAWKHYAKNQQLLDKYFDRNSAVIQPEKISFRDYPAGTAKERLAGLLCYRVLNAHNQGERYILELPERQFTPGPAQREQCLNALGVW